MRSETRTSTTARNDKFRPGPGQAGEVKKSTYSNTYGGGLHMLDMDRKGREKFKFSCNLSDIPAMHVRTRYVCIIQTYDQ